jgi:hypothetical protein
MVLLLFSAVLHLYVAWRLLPALGEPVAAAVFAAALAASALLVPAGLAARWLAARHRLAPRRAEMLAQVGLAALGLFSSLLVATVLRDLGLGALTLASLLSPAAGAVSPEVERASAWGVALVALMVTAFGAWQARRIAQVVEVEVPIAGLPAALDGFTIVQITDIHIGPTIKGRYLQAIVDRVNRLGADVVAITGDLVDGSVADLAPHVAPLADLRSRHGTFFVTGNHEYYSGAPPWIAELRRLGIRVLLNEHVVLGEGPQPLVLAGVTDVSAHHFEPAHRSDPVAALQGAPASAGVRVLLAHQPRSASAAAAAGFDLQISGHTHGGQFWPWNHFVRLQQPFTAGLHRLQHLWVYVSRGTGYWGPPKRVGAPSEITRLRLVAVPAIP